MNVIIGLHSQLAPFHALALVVNLRLDSWHMPSSLSKEAKILHVNMLALLVDNKTIPGEGEMLGEKESAKDLVVPKEPYWTKENTKEI